MIINFQVIFRVTVRVQEEDILKSEFMYEKHVVFAVMRKFQCREAPSKQLKLICLAWKIINARRLV